ncbi:unnamed protein product [Darwinula stevensoni]|uniref:ATP synthase subunit d, mitochondrial n=1 Tax=Darwinula stevensoni TaxID=69355 RepID=A0A7R8XCJ5_9CRUS|nr:unnamed protein product [Darwinula stevensoni]CAG0893823.1 unnamed protein product [Darwinula stevensoni]
MAARRITKSAIDWATFAERVPPEQKVQFFAFKGKSDLYLRKMLSLPEKPPTLNFEAYKTRVANAAAVDKLKKQYEAVKIPYPENKYSTKIDQLEKEAEKETMDFISASNARIHEYEKELSKWNTMIPLEQMTLQELHTSFPHLAHDPNNPTYYPHEPEYQPGYRADEEETTSH